MKLQDWIKILYEYGPFAILVFLVFVPERKIRTAIKEAPDADKRTLRWAYLLNWVAVFGLAVFSVYAWSRVHLVQQPVIHGIIENVPNDELVYTASESLYLHKSLQDNQKYSNYKWVLFKQMDEGSLIEFTIDPSKANPKNPDQGEAHIYDYQLPIEMDFYTKTLRLSRVNDDLYMAGRPEALIKRSKVASNQTLNTDAAENTSLELLLFPTAHAQAQQSFSIDDFAIGLESPDPIVRRKTRADLAKQNPIAAVPWIQNVLEDPRSSYRLKLGVLVALSQMPDVPAESLSRTTIAVIQTMLCHSDDTLRNEAYSFLQKLRLLPVVLYEHADSRGKSQGFGPCKYRADKGQFWKLPNDSASSVKVEKGYSVRLCEHEGPQGTGTRCETYPEGTRNLTTLSDRVSFVEVTKYDPTQQRPVRRR